MYNLSHARHPFQAPLVQTGVLGWQSVTDISCELAVACEQDES
jgi:hypothetical protein